MSRNRQNVFTNITPYFKTPKGFLGFDHVTNQIISKNGILFVKYV